MRSSTAENNEFVAVELTDEAFASYVALPSDAAFNTVTKHLTLLEGSPEMGVKYDPLYPAARLPFECRVLYCGNYGIYHHFDRHARKVTVLAIEDQRKNPETRFKR